MDEWAAVFNFFGYDIVNSWQFTVGIMSGSVLLLILNSLLAIKGKEILGVLVGVLGCLGFTILVGLVTLSSYEELVYQEASDALLGLTSVLPYIFFIILLLGVLAWNYIFRQGTDEQS